MSSCQLIVYKPSDKTVVAFFVNVNLIFNYDCTAIFFARMVLRFNVSIAVVHQTIDSQRFGSSPSVNVCTDSLNKTLFPVNPAVQMGKE